MWPEDWEEAVAVIAVTFSFTATEILAMGVEDLRFWVKQAAWVNSKR